MDELDRRIIRAIQIETRASVEAVAALLRVPTTTVRQRLRRFAQTGIVQMVSLPTMDSTKTVLSPPGSDDFDRLVDRAVEAVRTGKRDPELADWPEAFRDRSSGIDRAEDVLSEPTLEQARKPCFISIGGADGTELEKLLNVRPEAVGVLAEYDDRLLEHAAMRLGGRVKKNGQVKFVCGDAKQKTTYIGQLVSDWVHEDRCDLVLISIQAVLHELFQRGDKLGDLETFLAELMNNIPSNVPTTLIVREPVLPPELEGQEVYLRTVVAPERVEQVCKLIRDRHYPQSNVLLTGREVRTKGEIAWEALTKLFYIDELPYEIAELSASLSLDRISTILNRLFQGRVERTQFTSNSYKANWESFGVSLTSMKTGAAIPLPNSHVRFVCKRVPARREPERAVD